MYQPTSDKEKKWLHQLKQGKEEALQAIFKQYYKYLLVSAYNIIGDQDKAKDIVQDVFFELWKKHDRLTIETSLKAYLRRAAVNKSLNYLKMHKRFDWGEEHFSEHTPSKELSAQQQLEASDLQAAINQCIDKLPAKCKTIFSLSRFEKFSHKEIAAQLGISTKTIENQITKALKLIRAAVEEYNGLGVLLLLSFLI